MANMCLKIYNDTKTKEQKKRKSDFKVNFKQKYLDAYNQKILEDAEAKRLENERKKQLEQEQA